MHLVTTAIVPIILLLSLGSLIRHRYLADRAFWRGLEWVTYVVFMPALFITSISRTDLTAVSPGPLVLSLTVPTLVVSGAILALRRPLRIDGPRLTSLVQAGIRLNTYIGLIFASALHGETGVASFALASAVLVPLVNVVCVSVLAVHGDRGKGVRPGLLREIAGNPLIQGCVIGLALNLLGVRLPAFLATVLDMLAAPAVACGTLAVGAAIVFRIDRRDALDITATSLVKLIAMPLGAAALASALGIGGPMLAAIVIISALPCAPSAYVLAGRMGGDTRLMASLTGAQTVLSIGTLPLILALTT